MTVIGIDAGGTRTTGFLADAEARVIAAVRGPGANLHSEGEAGVERVLRDLLNELTTKKTVSAVGAIAVGMAGVARAEDVASVRRVLDRILPGVPSVVVSDALVALEAGTRGAAAIVLISGTGSIAYGRDQEGRAARAPSYTPPECTSA